jgi:hypothetical protein
MMRHVRHSHLPVSGTEVPTHRGSPALIWSIKVRYPYRAREILPHEQRLLTDRSPTSEPESVNQRTRRFDQGARSSSEKALLVWIRSDERVAIAWLPEKGNSSQVLGI